MQTIKVDLTNILGLTNQEILMRARADLRLGIPIVLTDKGNEAVIAPIDVLSQARLDQLKSIDENSFILITARRAQTLSAQYMMEILLESRLVMHQKLLF